jgi:hypothetical protein
LFLFLFFSVRFKKCTHDICIHGSPDTNEIQTESLRRKKNAPNKTAKDKWGKQALSAFQRNKFSFLSSVFHLFSCFLIIFILIWCWTLLKLASYRHTYRKQELNFQLSVVIERTYKCRYLS